MVDTMWLVGAWWRRVQGDDLPPASPFMDHGGQVVALLSSMLFPLFFLRIVQHVVAYRVEAESRKSAQAPLLALLVGVTVVLFAGGNTIGAFMGACHHP